MAIRATLKVVLEHCKRLEFGETLGEGGFLGGLKRESLEELPVQCLEKESCFWTGLVS